MKIISKNTKITSNQSGAILPLLAIAIVAILGIVALVVDLSKGTYTVNTIQEATDSASMSAVRQFNGTEDGWNSAKSAALLALQSNPISGVERETLEGVILNQNGPLGDATVGVNNNVRVTVARGVYWYDDETNRKRFISLEDGADNGKGPWLHQDFSRSVFANAVNVELDLSSVETSGFARVQGKATLNNLGERSVAVSDGEMELPVFPGAIPYCQLMLNTDSNESTDHILDTYSPKNALDREVFFTELEGFSTGTNNDSGFPQAPVDLREERIEGIRRYFSNIQPPTYNITDGTLCGAPGVNNGVGISCKHTPIQGLLGVTGNSPGEASIDEIRDYFEDVANNNAIKVSLGQHFRPLRAWPQGQGQGVIEDLTESMQKFIDSSDQTIDDVFVDINGNRKYAKANFPAARHMQEKDGNADFFKRPSVYFGSLDRLTGNRISWPLKDIDGTFRFGLLIGITNPKYPDLGRNPAELTPSDDVTYAPFINPMCNSSTKNLDKTNYKVKRYAVMVVAPGVDEVTYNGEHISYCDFKNQFSSGVQTSRVPWSKNEPRVVGVIKVDFIGFNFEDLLSRFPNGTPEYQSEEAGGLLIKDTSPGFLELNAKFKNEVDQYESEYSDCEEHGESDPKKCELNEIDDTIAIPDTIVECFDTSDFVLFKANVNGVSNQANQCEGLKKKCEDDDDCEPYDKCMDDLKEGVSGLSKFPFNIPAKLDKHCIPVPVEDASDFNAPESYKPFGNLRPGRGCGGVRARVADRDGVLLSTDKTWQEMKPLIVEDE